MVEAKTSKVYEVGIRTLWWRDIYTAADQRQDTQNVLLMMTPFSM
jgi:hypothetical protein